MADIAGSIRQISASIRSIQFAALHVAKVIDSIEQHPDRTDGPIALSAILQGGVPRHENTFVTLISGTFM